MSFLLDPPVLFIIGALLYLIGNRFRLERLARITIGLLVVLTFIIFSVLLYADIFRCVFPLVCNGLTGSEFMFHSDITGIYKEDVPLIVVVLLFAAYPLWIYLGYASVFMLLKRRRASNEVYSYKDVKSRKEISGSEYHVIRYPDIQQSIKDREQAVKVALEKLGGMQNFVKQGNKVLIKVNICGGVPHLSSTYTTKEVAGYVVDMVREAGGEPFICDADMVWTKFWPAAKEEGWIEWAKEKNVRLVNLSETKIVWFDFGEGIPRERVSREILDADVIISVPAMKTHLMTGVTLGMKNMYGTFPEIDKARYHKLGIDEVIYRVNNAFTPNLTIIDGSIGGETVGPLSCDAVEFHTFVVSNDVVTADSIAAQLMGFSASEIDHIKIANERGLGDAGQVFDFKSLPYTHTSDGNWKRPDPDVARFYTWGVHTMLKIPTWDTFFNLCSDFFLYDMARLPILRYFTPAFLQILHDIAKWSIDKEPDTPETVSRKRKNILIFSLFVIFSLFGFVSGGYFAQSSFEFILGLAFAFILGAWFSRKMKTRDIVTALLASMVVSYLVEHYAALAGMWSYLDGAKPPVFALFSTPILVVVITGVSSLLMQVFSYVDLSGKKFRIVPVILILAALFAFLVFEGYSGIISNEVAVIYAAFAVLGLFYNNRQDLEWNLAFGVTAVVLGGLMEVMGASSGLWGYAFGEKMPVFISLAWALNGWAVCGIVQIAGINLRDSLKE